MTTRRDFVTISVLGGAALALGAPRAGAAPKSMAVARESSFIKPFDDYFSQKLAAEYEKQTGIKITYEAVSVGGMLTRLTTIAETKSGPEIVGTGVNWPWLFDQSLVDVSDIAAEIGKKVGPWHDNVLDAVVVNKKWKALPWGNIGQSRCTGPTGSRSRLNKFPDNWEDLLAAAGVEEEGTLRLRAGPRLRRQPRLALPLLWSYGGRGRQGRQDRPPRFRRDGQAVDFCRRFYKETMFEDVLGWTDVNNNKAFWSSRSPARTCVVDPRRRQARLPRDRQGHRSCPQPAGAQGPLPHHAGGVHAIMTHAQDQAAAKAFLRWLYDDKQLSRWLASGEAYYAPFLEGYENHPMWNPEPRYLPYKESLKTTHLHGWPGPPSHAMSESVAKYVSSTCSPRPARASRPRTSSPPRRDSSSRSTKRSKRGRPAGTARAVCSVSGRMLSLRGFIEREGIFSWLMLAPGVLYLLAFVAYRSSTASS